MDRSPVVSSAAAQQKAVEAGRVLVDSDDVSAFIDAEGLGENGAWNINRR